MKKLRVVVVLGLVWLGFALAWGEEVVEEIVAIVNDDIITLSDYKNQHEALYQMLRAQFQGEEFQQHYRHERKKLLEMMITDLLLLQEAKKKGINVEEQVKLTIENIKEQNGINSDEELKRLMGQQGINFEAWKEQMEENILKQGVIATEVDRNIVVDDSEVVNYYKLHSQEFTEPQEYKLKAIFIAADNKTSQEAEDLKEKIDRKIAAGEDFSALASQYSEGPEKEHQGDLGTFKKGEMAKNLEQEVEKLKAGEITTWLEIKGGWYKLKLEEKKEAYLKSFEEVRKDIQEKLFAQKRKKQLDKFLKELKEKSYIKVLNPNPLGFD